MRRWLRPALLVLVVIALGLLALRALHLDADFPNHSRWHDDHAKYTDEGWYANAALNSALWGRWYLPGDWAPATLMPVWPAMLHGVFHFTGVSIVAARFLSVVFSWLVVLLAWWFFRREGDRDLAAYVFLLLAASSALYVFSRMALLEAPLVALALAAMLCAGTIRTGREIFAPALLGILLPLMVFTKTTGVFLVPAVLYPIAFRFRFRPMWKAAARPLVVIALLACGIYAAEHFLFAARYAQDIREFLHHSEAKISALQTARKGVRFFYRGFTWVDPILFPIALVGLIASWWMRELWHDVAWGVCVLWSVGYAAFIIYHFDGPPRYFSVLVVPVTMMAVLFTAAVWRRNAVIGRVLAVLCVSAFLFNVGSVVRMARHPQYTELAAMQQVRALVLSHPEVPRVLIGNGSAQAEFFTGLPAVDDTHGTMPEWQKVDVYNPGWVVIWSDESLLDLRDVQSRRAMVKMGEFPALDDPRRAELIVYQLQPKPVQTAPDATPAPAEQQ